MQRISVSGMLGAPSCIRASTQGGYHLSDQELKISFPGYAELFANYGIEILTELHSENS